LAWVAYSFIIDDWFLYVPNTLSLLIGATFFFLTVHPDQKVRDSLLPIGRPSFTLHQLNFFAWF
jgi:hypothetical protein